MVDGVWVSKTSPHHNPRTPTYHKLPANRTQTNARVFLMPSDHSSLYSLYMALALPLFLLYLFVLISFFDRARRSSSFHYIVSIRDAAVATLALDFAALSENILPFFERISPSPALLTILLIATLAHLVALQIAMRRSGEFSDALEKIDTNSFATRLSSLYVSTILLLTNGTTLLAVLELVRSSK
jgi:hypothetical protein